MAGFAQQNTSLTFTGINNTNYVQLDSIRIMNRAWDCDTVLHWPDTVLTLTIVGNPEFRHPDDRLQVFQNYPNPVAYETNISVYLPGKEEVSILITDITGKTHISQTLQLEMGTHMFHFIPGASKLYMFTVWGRFGKSSIKIQSIGKSKIQNPVLTYSGQSNNQNAEVKSQKAWRGFVFTPGDELVITGFYNSMESGILDTPELSEDYILQFAYDISCPGIPTVEYGGQVYNTVQIFNQCWLKENLNYEAGNSWCYDNNPSNCDMYGRFYDWETALSVCPSGWYLPTDNDWKILEGTVDVQYPVGDQEWDNILWRGLDAGENLKTTYGWNSNGNGNDLFGFAALPGGNYDGSWWFSGLGIQGNWWSSSEFSDSYRWYRHLNDVSGSLRYDTDKTYGLSVRCIKGNQLPTITTASITNITQTTAAGGGNIISDGGSAVSVRGVCWSTSRNPDINDDHTNDDSGTGTFTSQLTGLNESTIYYVRAYATNSEGIAYGNQVFFTTQNSGGGISNPCPGVETITYGGQVYNTVLIGNQCWLAENLNYEAGNNWCYDNDPSNCDIYGRLYDWETALSVCPTGWHLPTDNEWKILEGTVDSQYPVGDPEWDNSGWQGLDAGKNLKSISGWYNNGNGINIFGFSALPGGILNDSDYFVSLSEEGYFWSSSEINSHFVWGRALSYSNSGVSRGYYPKIYSGRSVRCVKD